MANPHRGEVGFTADGKEWVLRYSANAICTLEDEFDMDMGALVKMLDGKNGVRMSTLRTVFWAGLLDRHPDATKEQAGELISDVGFGEAGPLVGRALAAAFPPEDNSKARPRKGGKAGTGKGS